MSLSSKVLIISHYYKRTLTGGGPPQEVRDFFLPKVKKLYYIEHPFPSASDHKSSMTIYRDGRLEKQIFSPPVYGPDWLRYILNVIFALYFYIRSPLVYDICVSLDNLNTFSVLPLRKLNLIKRLVFYTIDYTPLRFKNVILNSIYHFVDRLACYNADAIWILSPRMILARKQNGVDIKRIAQSIHLPMGANLERIKIQHLNRINRHQIVYAGFLMEKQGIQLAIESLPKVIEKIPDVKFIIIGQGEYERKLKQLVKNLKIAKYVDFKGFVEDHEELEKILSKSALAVASYVDTPDNYTRYTDPGKVKLYLGCGLPVIMTDVPQIARVIKSKKAGIIADYNSNSFAESIIKLFSNDKLYNKYRENAIKLSKNYNTNTLIEKALNKTN